MMFSAKASSAGRMYASESASPPARTLVSSPSGPVTAAATSSAEVTQMKTASFSRPSAAKLSARVAPASCKPAG